MYKLTLTNSEKSTDAVDVEASLGVALVVPPSLDSVQKVVFGQWADCRLQAMFLAMSIEILIEALVALENSIGPELKEKILPLLKLWKQEMTYHKML